MSAAKPAPQTERKDKFVELPTRMILTGAGLALFQKSGTPIGRVLNRDGIQREGVESPRFHAGTMQKMVMNSYIEEIFAPVPDLLSRRYHVISTNNLIVYAILYKKLSPSLGKTMFETNVVREFNRKNPGKSIVDLKQIPTATAENLVKVKAEHIKKLEAELHAGVAQLVMNNTALGDEDRRSMILSLPKFLAWMDKRIWYLYYVIYLSGYQEQMRRVFTRMLAQYLDHTRIATHLSNLLMEFVQNAEKAHFERIIVKGGFARREEVDKFLRSRENRESVTLAARQSRQMLDLSWNMNPERMTIGQQYRIQINVSNFGIIDDRVRMELSKKMKTNVDGIGISDFYDGGGDPEKLGAGLGLLYNSYLEDICKQEGIQYRCNIYPEPAKEKTTVRIEISL